MHQEVLINVTPQETRVAYLENGMLQEIFIERSKNKGLVGNIYLGTVARVLPGMQAAFIDVGLDRTAFLHAKDLSPRQDNHNQFQAPGAESAITSRLTEGQRVLVQVVKDPLGSKGARLSGQISIPARNIVLLPGSEYIGISQRIPGDQNRDRLLSMLKEQVASINAPGGFILRTAGENATSNEIHSDLIYVLRVWERIVQKQKVVSSPSLVHQDLVLAMRTVRDLTWQNIEKVRIDSRETYDQVSGFVRDLIPAAVDLIEHYPGGRPIFELYGVEDEIHKALQRKVPLKSGGYLIIDQTEAMTTIDINTGSYVGNRNLEETIFRTNLEAATSLARQLRVRNLGGIIIIDFIDMNSEEHCDQVMRTLKRELARDGKKSQANPMSSLGLVEITRKRTSESLERLLTESCPNCDGRGIQKTPETICYEIFREILRTAREFEAEQYLVVASQSVIDLLLEEESTGIADLEIFIKKEIKLQVEPGYCQEQYDVVMM
jgi:ribonuclease G